MQWLIEKEVFDDVEPLLEALQRLKVDHTVCKLGIPYESYISYFGRADKIVFYGSFQFAKLIQAKSPYITVYCNFSQLDCTYYYPRFGNYLLNSDYIMLPYGEINRRKKWLGKHLGGERFFIRPCGCKKAFTGSLVNFGEKQVISPEELVVIAPPIKLTAEWRLVIFEGKVLTGSQYKKVRSKDVPDKVLYYAQEVLGNIKYRPDILWTLDICETASGELKVLEVGSFSCAGLYNCDYDLVINTVENLISTQ